jgi:release factor glutamine methyltransferase
MNTFRELLQAARKYLKEHGIADADLDAWYLLAHVFKISRSVYFMQEDKTVPKRKKNIYMELLERRAEHVPLQLLIGIQEFMGLELDVTKDVLIPRQDTEILVEEVFKICNQKTVLDMCTGSGCIIIALTKYGKIKKAVGVDISEKALIVAEANARKHDVEVIFLQSDLFEHIEGSYDIIVANPPYIPTGEIADLMPEVRDYEPVMALDGDNDGLIFYRRIIAVLKEHLSRNGYIFFEIGYNQGIEVAQMLSDAGFLNVQIRKDFCGLDRVVYARRN